MSSDATDAARAAIEHAARESYGRLLAFLSARTRDVAAAQDALADALCAALESWPADGVPQRPEAWLFAVARNRLVDHARRSAVAAEAAETLLLVGHELAGEPAAEAVFPDDRLKLLFVCAHPAIDAALRAPLMLQVVLGLDAARIASAFVVKPSTMGQRLTRAKAKIRDARIPFEVPPSSDLAGRLDCVRQAIYAAYTCGWQDVEAGEAARGGLSIEALELGYLLARFMPDEPENLGLLALMLYCEARKAARRRGGRYVPLSEQDPREWDAMLARAANALLVRAQDMERIGRFQLEAAIQAAHARRAVTGVADWEEIALLYEGLAGLAPTIGALTGRAAAIAQARGAKVGWTYLEMLPVEDVSEYQPYWALRAHLLQDLGRHAEAQSAFDRAIGLCTDPAMRSHLAGMRERGAA